MSKRSVVSEILSAMPTGIRPPDKRTPLDINSRSGLRNVLDQRYLAKGEMPDSSLNKTMVVPRDSNTLEKSFRKFLDGPEDSIERLAFERDPQRISEFAGLYRPKIALIPDTLLKRAAIQDDLVAAIVHTRCNHLSQLGRKQPNRHSKGFVMEIDTDIDASLDDAQKRKLQDRINRAERLLLTCGHTKGWGKQDRCSFAEYLYLSTRNAVVVGRTATEVISVPDKNDPTKRVFHSFRPTDAGTIYYAAPYRDAQEAVRQQARILLAQLKNEKLVEDKFINDEYAWVQVIEGRPTQAFSSDEMLVQNFYPVTDLELQGYPLTPLDTALTAVTTHLNISSHNKLYFQYGRAARGMLVIKSQDVDAEVVQAVKQQFNASINSVSNSFRMPCFGISPDDEITWQPIDQGSRDAEFQFLSDSNARTILAAFQMSPEELPGYQHLSRGTSNQALSESNNEYKLTAARDVGIRPLVAKIEDHLNDSLLPLIDPELAKIVKIRLVGLDVDDQEKESVRLQQDMGVHMTYDEVLGKVEKDPLGKDLCGGFPLNQQVMAYIEKYMTFGEILAKLRGVKGADKDPSLQFYQNPAWLQFYGLQAQQQAQQAPPGQPGQNKQSSDGQGGGELGSAVDQLGAMLGKSEGFRGTLKAHQAKLNRYIMDTFQAETVKLVSEIADIADIHKPQPPVEKK